MEYVANPRANRNLNRRSISYLKRFKEMQRQQEELVGSVHSRLSNASGRQYINPSSLNEKEQFCTTIRIGGINLGRKMKSDCDKD
jgi:hypothetical protein